MLSGDTAVIAETGDSWFNCQKLSLPKNCGYEFQMQYGSIGWSVGATLGYAQAAKDKCVIAFIGDGSFQVIHYELPNDAETFVNRFGRTGREGKEGSAILMFSNNQRRTIRSLERDVGCKFDFISPPAVGEVLESSAEQFIATLGGVHPESVDFFTPTAQKLIEEQGTSDLAAAIAQLSGFSRPPSSRSLISYEQVEQLEQDVAELWQSLADKQEQENAMLQVLMRVEQEQRVTEDAKILTNVEELELEESSDDLEEDRLEIGEESSRHIDQLISITVALFLKQEIYMFNLDFLEENDDEVDLT